MSSLPSGAYVVSAEDYARDQRLKREADEQAAAVREIVERIRPALRPAPRVPDHAFQPYANARVNPGCIRCPWPRERHPMPEGL
jgi:hypothetical protein